MMLIDTSVQVDHLRSNEPPLAEARESGLVLAHPFLMAELACGNLWTRDRGLAQIADTLHLAYHEE